MRREDIKIGREISFMKKRLVLAMVGISWLTVSFEGVMAAEKFPVRPIKILVGFSPDVTADLLCRMFGSLVSEDLGNR